MRRLTRVLALAALCVAGPVAGQIPTPRPSADTGKQKPPIRAAAESVSRRGSLSTLLTRSRQAGLSDARVTALYDQLRRHGVADTEAQQLILGEVGAVGAGAPKQTFGTIVNQQVARGLRGRDLASAIRVEQDRRRRKPAP